jgi:hypothetical protein
MLELNKIYNIRFSVRKYIKTVKENGDQTANAYWKLEEEESRGDDDD